MKFRDSGPMLRLASLLACGFFGVPAGAQTATADSTAAGLSTSDPLDPNRLSTEPEGRRHKGFFFRMGMGMGWLWEQNSFSSVADKDKVKGVAYRPELLFGGTLRGGIVIGGGLVPLVVPTATFDTSLLDGEADGYVNVITAVGFTNIYLDDRGGLQLQFSAGFGAVNNVLREGLIIRDAQGRYVDDVSLDSSGQGGVLGAGFGWDAYVSKSWSLGVMANVTALYAVGEMDDFNFRDEKVKNLAMIPALSCNATLN